MFSSNIKINNLSITDTQPQWQNRAWNGQLIQRSTGIQYFELSMTLNFNYKYMPEVRQFITQYSGGAPFTQSLGFYSAYSGKQSTAISVTAPVNAGSNIVPCTTNNLEIGTLIQFQNGTKIYRVLSSTQNSITVFPNLRQNVQVGENINFQNIIGSWVLDPSTSLQLQVQAAMSLQIKATEAL